jgi:hypothetical protein
MWVDDGGWRQHEAPLSGDAAPRVLRRALHAFARAFPGEWPDAAADAAADGGSIQRQLGHGHSQGQIRNHNSNHINHNLSPNRGQQSQSHRALPPGDGAASGGVLARNVVTAAFAGVPEAAAAAEVLAAIDAARGRFLEPAAKSAALLATAQPLLARLCAVSGVSWGARLRRVPALRTRDVALVRAISLFDQLSGSIVCGGFIWEV